MDEKKPAVGAQLVRHVGPAAEARWYSQNRIGMAQLCISEIDARARAHESDQVWPHLAPHKAVQLIDAAEERERLREILGPLLCFANLHRPKRISAYDERTLRRARAAMSGPNA